MNKKLKFILMWAIIIITAIVVVLFREDRLFPLKVANGSADIETLEVNNPKEKTVTLKAYAVNRTLLS